MGTDFGRRVEEVRVMLLCHFDVDAHPHFGIFPEANRYAEFTLTPSFGVNLSSVGLKLSVFLASGNNQ